MIGNKLLSGVGGSTPLPQNFTVKPSSFNVLGVSIFVFSFSRTSNLSCEWNQLIAKSAYLQVIIPHDDPKRNPWWTLEFLQLYSLAPSNPSVSSKHHQKSHDVTNRFSSRLDTFDRRFHKEMGRLLSESVGRKFIRNFEANSILLYHTWEKTILPPLSV